jgi:hypothetical protein
MATAVGTKTARTANNKTGNFALLFILSPIIQLPTEKSAWRLFLYFSLKKINTFIEKNQHLFSVTEKNPPIHASG